MFGQNRHVAPSLAENRKRRRVSLAFDYHNRRKKISTERMKGTAKTPRKPRIQDKFEI
jgi:hypothetical protein